MKTEFKLILPIVILSCFWVTSQISESTINSIEPKVIEWRHHIHQNPELSNREFETAK